MLSDPSITVLGSDPAHRRCVLNGNAFQQDAVTSFQGWQYAVFYSALTPESAPEPLFIHVARRCLPSGSWEVLVLDDYPQTTDDGHNTVQIGICPGDGTIHLSYDHHCDILRYRYSIRDLATRPSDFPWTSSLFTPTLNYLPGLPSTHPFFDYVTYPRFCRTSTDLFCTFRDGKAGLGNDHLFLYSSTTGHYRYIGAHLVGIQSNPYIHGLDFDHRTNRLHTTWVYRGFVHYEGWDDPADTKHKQQAGPNGAENNHDLCYAYSDDLGSTWKNGGGMVVARVSEGEAVTNESEGIRAFEIPKGMGLTNQEAQAVNGEGGVHVLNRDSVDGNYLWKHYYRNPEGVWSQRGIRPVDGPRRGRLAVSKDGDLLFILPDSTSPTMRILKATEAGKYATYEEIWVGHGLSGEPLVDTARLEHDNVLSVFARKEIDGKAERKDVVIMDFQLY